MDNLELTLKPRWENNTVADMQIYMSLPVSALPDKGAELMYCEEGWLCVPFAVFEDLEITDDLGRIEYMEEEGISIYGIKFKNLCFQRRPEGILKWQYKIFPRILPEGYRSSPYYDFRSEPFGMNGSGAFAFILPSLEVKFYVRLHWDMSLMPENARGVWSLGTGDSCWQLDAWRLRNTYFAAGIMNAEEEDEFGIYWYGEPSFDIRSTTARLKDMFEYMKRFFHDDNPVYRIFIRRDPFEQSGGGSGALRSFMIGYHEKSEIDMGNWFCRLAHEMVHNWPRMNDNIVGEGTWYTEGIAEYYSAVLPYRAGLTDKQETVRQINNKAKRYLENIYRELPNMEIPKIQWKDRRAQVVPYGKGFLYLANVEAQLKRLGKGSIDEIAVLYYEDHMMKPEDWEAFIRERLGEKGIQEYEDMKAGRLVIPDPDSFGGLFRVKETEIKLDGKTVKSYEWEVKE